MLYSHKWWTDEWGPVRGTSSISFPRVALRMKKLITMARYW